VIGRALFARKIHAHTGLAGWIYTLGSVVMFLFILQALPWLLDDKDRYLGEVDNPARDTAS
jgi:hypothetical protein